MLKNLLIGVASGVLGCFILGAVCTKILEKEYIRNKNVR